jgi:hypothetical protein
MAEADDYSAEDEAAHAFEALRTEVSALRAAIEQQAQAFTSVRLKTKSSRVSS